MNDLVEADVLFTLRTYYRKRPRAIVDAERRGVPVYVLRNNTVTQMENYLNELFGVNREPDVEAARTALEEARRAIDLVASGKRNSVQLAPQNAFLRRLQHELTKETHLFSRSSGSEPGRRVTIYNNHRGNG